MITFSFTNPSKDECLLGLLTDSDIQISYEDFDENIIQEQKQLISIGLIIFRIDILL